MGINGPDDFGSKDVFGLLFDKGKRVANAGITAIRRLSSSDEVETIEEVQPQEENQSQEEALPQEEVQSPESDDDYVDRMRREFPDIFKTGLL